MDARQRYAPEHSGIWYGRGTLSVVVYEKQGNVAFIPPDSVYSSQEVIVRLGPTTYPLVVFSQIKRSMCIRPTQIRFHTTQAFRHPPAPYPLLINCSITSLREPRNP